jgi:NAD-dependent SIR2 family protein deacetylase
MVVVNMKCEKCGKKIQDHEAYYREEHFGMIYCESCGEEELTYSNEVGGFVLKEECVPLLDDNVSDGKIYHLIGVQ